MEKNSENWCFYANFFSVSIFYFVYWSPFLFLKFDYKVNNWFFLINKFSDLSIANNSDLLEYLCFLNVIRFVPFVFWG